MKLKIFLLKPISLQFNKPKSFWSSSKLLSAKDTTDEIVYTFEPIKLVLKKNLFWYWGYPEILLGFTWNYFLFSDPLVFEMNSTILSTGSAIKTSITLRNILFFRESNKMRCDCSNSSSITFSDSSGYHLCTYPCPKFIHLHFLSPLLTKYVAGSLWAPKNRNSYASNFPPSDKLITPILGSIIDEPTTSVKIPFKLPNVKTASDFSSKTFSLGLKNCPRGHYLHHLLIYSWIAIFQILSYKRHEQLNLEV